jgi:hypothetical protein
MDPDDLKPPPLPRKSDILFRDDLPDWQNNACLNVMHGGDHLGYMEGYLRGAQKLVQHVIETGRDQDFLVYPIIFLFRHHIELVLKRIILRAPYLIERKLTDAEKRHLGKHRLDLLWQDLKPMFTIICERAGWGTPDSEDVAGIDAYIWQLQELDPDSFSFRYARTKDGSPTLPSDLKGVNVRHFAEMMERFSSYLDGIDSATDYLEECRAEMEVEWRSGMASYMDWS